MENISREQIELLIALQQRETEIDKIDVELSKLPVKLKEIETVLNDFEVLLEEKKTALSELKKTYRSHDADIQQHQGRIQKREVQLHAVKTNKDYQAILKEIGEIKSLISGIEDQTLACLDKIDAADEALRLTQEEFASEEEKIREKQAIMESEAKAHTARRQVLLDERDHLAGLIDAELSQLYQTSRSLAGKPAIVEVRTSVCLGCNMNIPPQMYNELHRGNTLRNCPHCHRLIYVI
ncbi:MAG: hypothetical protein C4548_10760 [Desulfobacteraceae bacterium]|jgi:predicted  nucleic acid-binding Zn-ribbon protein|nr:MAG: hypothetical protein C4548_10760 [Desulfobacteraceae bacterium]